MSDTPLDTAKESFVRAGGRLAAQNIQNRLSKARDRARQESQDAVKPPNEDSAKFIQSSLSVLSIIFVTAVLIIGILALLIIVPLAEYLAVYEGLKVVTSDTIAAVTTVALFIGLLVLMFMVHLYADNLENGYPRKSVRHWAKGIGHTFGLDQNKSYTKLFNLDQLRDFDRIEHAYMRLTTTLRFVKVGILSASIVGRLTDVMNTYGDDTVATALENIQNNLTISELVGTVISFVVLFGLIWILDVGVLFVYTAFKNTAGTLNLKNAHAVDGELLRVELSERYQSEVLQDLTLQLQAQNQPQLPPEQTSQ